MTETLPEILDIRTVAKSRLLEIQAVDLKFSNGTDRTYERLKPFQFDSVMALAIDNDELLMVKEYAMGTAQYELGFVKGGMDPNETPIESAHRELQEEIGFGAKNWVLLRSIKMNPQIMDYRMHIVLGTDLYPSQLEGDEPEPLEIVRVPLSKLDELIAQTDFNEARNLVALYCLRDYLKNI